MKANEKMHRFFNLHESARVWRGRTLPLLCVPLSLSHASTITVYARWNTEAEESRGQCGARQLTTSRIAAFTQQLRHESLIKKLSHACARTHKHTCCIKKKVSKFDGKICLFPPCCHWLASISPRPVNESSHRSVQIVCGNQQNPQFPD